MKEKDDNITILELLTQIDIGATISEEEKKILLEVKTLSLKGLKLTTLPQSICLLENLLMLDASDNLIMVLPESVGKLSKLQKLDISNNQLNELPECIADLFELDTLLVFDNNLTTIPYTLTLLRKLRVLDISSNEISSLPDFSELQSLEMLSCSANRISMLPESLENLCNLSVLDIANNPIYKLPNNIGKLEKLQYLDLSGLRLHSIPEAILDCKLDFIFDSREYVENGGILLSNTTLDTQPVVLFKQDRDTIRNYYESEHIEINNANVFFLGDGGVGKTYIINRLWNDYKNVITCETNEIECIRKNEFYGNKEVNLTIWDFGSQAIMHSLYPIFLKNNSCYVIVVNNRFGIYEQRIEYWLNAISRYTTDSKVLIIENRFDGFNNSIINIDRLKRKYRFCVEYMAINAKTDTLSGLKEKILEMVSGLNYPIIPTKWNVVKNELLSDSGSRNWIHIDYYNDLCQRNGIYDEESRKKLLEWFNNAGICCYCNLKETLGSVIVISPSWIAKFYYLLFGIGHYYSVNGILNVNGVINYLNQPQDKLKGTYTVFEMDYILELYEQFGLLKRLSNGLFFLPGLIDIGQSPEDNDLIKKYENQEHVKYELVYPYIPSALMSQLMIRNYELILADHSSRKKLVLETFHNQMMTIITQNNSSLIVDVFSKNKVPTGLQLQAILKDIHEISSEWGLWPKEYVYANNDGVSEKISMDDLLHIVRRESTYVGEYANYSVNEILYDVYGTEELANIQRMNELHLQWEEIKKKLEKLTEEKPESEYISYEDYQSVLKEVLNTNPMTAPMTAPISRRDKKRLSFLGVIGELIGYIFRSILHI